MSTARARGLFLLTNLLVCLAGCGVVPSPPASSPPSSAAPLPSPAPSEEPPVGAAREVLVRLDDVAMTLRIDRDPMPTAGVTRATVLVENPGAVPILWQGGGCDFLASITIDLARPVTIDPGIAWPGLLGRFKSLIGPAAEPIPTWAFADDRFADLEQVACPANLAVNEIAAGASVEMRASWDGFVSGMAAPVGPTTVVASFPYMGRKVAGADPFAAPVRPIEARIVSQVAGIPPAAIGPALAVDAALSVPAFAEWVSGAPIEEWRGVNLRRHDGRYEVSLDRLQGDRELVGTVTVDAATGAILGFEIVAPPTR
jgi:hypothetical protein